MVLKLLFIEDDKELRENLKKLFHDDTIDGYKLSVQVEESFEKSQELIKNSDFDIVVLDLFNDGVQKDEDAGLKVLQTIRDFLFIPVIFYTGYAYKILDYKSEIVGVVNKGDGIEALTSEIKRIINSKLALLKKNINEHINQELKQYFWETVDKQKDIFNSQDIDYSLGYLILRRISKSLSKENIKKILGDDKIKEEKVHPMEFYLYPPSTREFESGEILEKDGVFYAILTPDCDMIDRGNGLRKAKKVLLAATTNFKSLPDFIKYDGLKNKQNKTYDENQQLSNCTSKLKVWMSNRGGEQDRYFYLPSTPFIENMVIDFQNKIMVDYADLRNYTRVAKLDMPFAQSMISSFIRYYNRIGFPDIDVDYLMQKL
jgi:CheY-like chemotaxis protein